MPAKKEENMFSAKYIAHTPGKLDTSKLSKVSRIPDTFQLADVPPQAAAIDPTSPLLSLDRAPGTQCRAHTAPATR